MLCLVFRLCPTLCNPMDCSPPSSSVYADSAGKNNWSELPCPPPGDLPNPRIEPSLRHCRRFLSCLSHQGSQRTKLGYTLIFRYRSKEEPERRQNHQVSKRTTRKVQTNKRRGFNSKLSFVLFCFVFTISVITFYLLVFSTLISKDLLNIPICIYLLKAQSSSIYCTSDAELDAN